MGEDRRNFVRESRRNPSYGTPGGGLSGWSRGEIGRANRR